MGFSPRFPNVQQEVKEGVMEWDHPTRYNLENDKCFPSNQHFLHWMIQIVLIDQFPTTDEETKVNCNMHEIDQQKKRELIIY